MTNTTSPAPSLRRALVEARGFFAFGAVLDVLGGLAFLLPGETLAVVLLAIGGFAILLGTGVAANLYAIDQNLNRR